MWNKISYYLLLISFFYLIGLFGLAAEEQEIEWGSSKIAKAYKLELRDFTTKKMKLDKKVKTTSYKIDKLDPGIYEYRIGIINDKDVTVIYSDWTTLSVIQAFEPEGSVEEIYYGGKQDKFQEIYISGNNFYEDTKIEVFSSQGKIPVKNLVRINDREMKFILELSNAKPGSYDLKIINPLNKVFVKKDFYLLGKTKEDAEKVIVEAAKKSQGIETSIDRRYFHKSAILPGWGQYASGKDYDSKARRVRGGIVFGATLGLGAFVAVSYRDYLNTKNEVNDKYALSNAVNYPYNPSQSIAGLYLSQQFNAGVLELDQKWHTFTSSGLVFVGLYIFNLIDAYFFTGPIVNPATAFGSDKPHQIKAYVLPDRNGVLNSGAVNIGSSYILEYSFRF